MPPTPEDRQLYVYLALTAVAAVLSILLIKPYLFYLASAVILVYIAYPFYTRLEARIGNESLAALLSLLVLILVAVIPTVMFASMTYDQGQQVLSNIGTSIPDYVDTTELEGFIQERLGRDVNIEAKLSEAFREAGNIFSTELPSIIRTLLDAFIGMSVMGFTMYYLFKDGDDVYETVRWAIPLQDDIEQELFDSLDNMLEAILLGHLLTSAVTAILAGIGMAAVGIPNVTFWIFVMFLLGIIPVIGNFVVWGGAGLIMIFFQNQPLLGTLLLAYGTIFVGTVDNMTRMKMVQKRGKIHPLLVLIGVMGGIPLLGLLGMVLGPLIIGAFIVLVRVYRTSFLGQSGPHQ